MGLLNAKGVFENIGIILSSLVGLKPSQSSQRRRNIRALWKIYRKLNRRLKKDGYTEKEKQILDNTLNAIDIAISRLNEIK
jgi:hypothetical protein